MVGSLPRGMPKIVDCRQTDAQVCQDEDVQSCGGIDPLYPHGYTWAAPPEVA